MSNYDALLSDASQLPLGERIQLIEAFWDVVVPEEEMPPLSDEWAAEIQRRSVEYDAGNVQATPWEEIRADALRRAGL